MVPWFRKFLRRFMEYDIVGEYYTSDKEGHYVRKYQHKYHLKKRRKS